MAIHILTSGIEDSFRGFEMGVVDCPTKPQPCEEDNFSKLTERIRQARRIQRVTLGPSRITTIESEGIRSLRHRLGKAKSKFALKIGISVVTLLS